MKHLILTIALIGASGCLGPREVLPVHRYTLQPAIYVESTTTRPQTLGIRPAEIAAPYGTKLAYIDAGLRLAYWNNDVWAENPANAFTRLLQDAIAQTKAFADTGNAADMARPDFYLTGTIRKFHAREGAEGPAAEIEVLLEVREARGAGKLWDGLLSETVPMTAFDAPSLAEAMNKAMVNVVETAAAGIAGTVPASE